MNFKTQTDEEALKKYKFRIKLPRWIQLLILRFQTPVFPIYIDHFDSRVFLVDDNSDHILSFILLEEPEINKGLISLNSSEYTEVCGDKNGEGAIEGSISLDPVHWYISSNRDLKRLIYIYAKSLYRTYESKTPKL